MKWLGAGVCFCLLVAATCWVWNRRFEPQAGRTVVRVDDGSGVGFTVEKAHGGPSFARVVGLPFGGPVGILHLRLAYRAVDLERGEEKWQDGRLILDWLDAEGRVVAHDTVMTLQGSDNKTRSADMIVRSAEPGLVPRLRIEHLGLSGRMEIRSLQAVAVRERGWVRWVSVGLLCLWGGWAYGFVRALSNAARPRLAVAAVMLVAMGWFLVVPGPWAHQRPLVGDFLIGGESMATVSVGVFAGISGQDVEPLAEMPTQGSWLVKVKKALSFLRPVLHVLLFAGPAFVLAFLCGARCAWWCGVLASCAVEAGQIGFGFGFDWVDVIDLLVDWAGIAVAVWGWRKCRVPSEK